MRYFDMAAIHSATSQARALDVPGSSAVIELRTTGVEGMTQEIAQEMAQSLEHTVTELTRWLAEIAADWDLRSSALSSMSPPSSRLDDTFTRGEVDQMFRRLTHGDPSAATIAAFFDRMPRWAQVHLALEFPALVGDLAGTPLGLRAIANRQLMGARAADLRAVIGALLDHVEGQPKSLGELHDYGEALEQLQGAEEELRLLEGWLRTSRTFVLYDPAGDGRVAEWVGPLDADHIVFYVPGTTHDKLTIDGLAERTNRLQNAAAALTSDSVAVVTTLVYDPPDTVPSAGLERWADEGAPEIKRFFEGLPLGDEAHISVIAHSYGSTAIGKALSRGVEFPLDDLIIIGSPGVTVGHVSELNVDANHVWVGLTDDDPIKHTSVDYNGDQLSGIIARWFFGFRWDSRSVNPDHMRFGNNPADDDFGANVFDTGDASGHGGYLDEPDEEAFENIVEIIIGLRP